jgi:ribulose-phosphate 3-epimerase
MKKIISPSLLSADFGRLNDAIDMINASDAEWLHLDIMDGVFVPNISFGFPVIEAVRKRCTKKLDTHLMIENPDKFISDFARAGVDILNVHYEVCTHLHRSIQRIKAENMQAAVTLNPHTPVALLEDIIRDVDMVLLMSVNPGFAGQRFIEEVYEKTARLKELILRKNAHALIQIDGGVNYEVGKKLFEAGADVLVAGSFVFGSENPLETITRLREL